ncbi:MAG TPA: nucleotide exchange factor GrpE [Vicinamibacterales bacterium]|nr:nucleotide exchange factor GrpE [Vicinamibacterales bacterium]
MADEEHDIPVKVVDRRWWVNPEASSAASADARGTGKPTYVEQLEQQIAEKDRQIQEYLSKYRSAASEFEEARLRLRREISKDIERARRETLSELLEVVDNLDRAVESARQGASADALVQGIEMVRRQFLAKLESFGVTRIEATEQPFDPTLHEAISSVPASSPEQDGLVVGTVRCGYRIGDDVLRPAAVAVAKA